MKMIDKKNVIEFYEKQVYWLGMQKSDELTEETLKDLKDTMWFSRWMLSNHYDECVSSVKDIINRLSRYRWMCNINDVMTNPPPSYHDNPSTYQTPKQPKLVNFESALSEVVGGIWP